MDVSPKPGDLPAWAAGYTASRILSRQPCLRGILRKVLSIDFCDYEDFMIHDYAAQAHIKAPVAV